jgi:hypothetical protein
MRINTREAIIGLIVYRIVRRLVLRSLSGKKGVSRMASGKKLGIVAAIAAALGALMFWRKKKKGSAEVV